MELVMEVMEVTMARGLLSQLPKLRPPLLPTTAAMVAMVDTDTARGPLMPMPTTAMAAMVTATDTARGPLMPMPTTAMAAMVDTDTARGPLMLMPTTAMAATVTDMDTARGLLMLTTATATAMAVMAMASNSTMEENHSAKRPIPFEPNSKTIRLKYCTIFP